VHDFIRGSFSRQFSLARQRWCQSNELPCSDVLSPERLQAALAEEDVHYREGVFTPLITLWTFLAQVFSPDHSCRDAVARLIAFRATHGQRTCSARTASYCRARKRLSESLLARLVRGAGDQLHEQVVNDQLSIGGRRVYVADGTTVSMPDTPANQQAYPQARAQRPGIGFPIARLLALFSLTSGAVVDMAIDKYRGKGTGEQTLLRNLLGRLQSESVLLGDRNFCTYWNLALLLDLGAYGIFRLHQARRQDARGARRLGPNDWLRVWPRPKRPDWMNQSDYDALLDEIVVRYVRVEVYQAGFRVRRLVIATTLLDPIEAPAAEIAKLFRARWQAELKLRSLKSVLQMDVLRCKTPEMVRKEIWLHMLAYNLVRETMAQAARQSNVQPHEISFKGALQTMNRFHDLVLQATPEQLQKRLNLMLDAIAKHRVANRPDRYEPRAIKRRPKPHDLLLAPRTEARKRLLEKD
jgi:Transposase DDE domain